MGGERQGRWCWEGVQHFSLSSLEEEEECLSSLEEEEECLSPLRRLQEQWRREDPAKVSPQEEWGGGGEEARVLPRVPGSIFSM